jgi:hypothetical protein
MSSGLSANGTSHVANSHIIMPKAYMSVAVDFGSPLNRSGAENARVATLAELPTLGIEDMVLST